MAPRLDMQNLCNAISECEVEVKAQLEILNEALAKKDIKAAQQASAAIDQAIDKLNKTTSEITVAATNPSPDISAPMPLQSAPITIRVMPAPGVPPA